MGHKKPPEPESGSEGWLVSYCDMISLLVTFFLMMMTFSTSSAGDIREVGIGLLKGRGGIFTNLSGSQPPEEVDPTVIEHMAKELDHLRESAGDDNAVGLTPATDGLSILFDSECSFAQGSARVNERLRENLRGLARVLGHYDQMIVVEGFTDSAFAPTEEFSTAEQLAAARAFNAAQVLFAEPALAPDQVQIAGLGTARPRAEEDTALGRELNRRVELKLLAVTRARALAGAGTPQVKQEVR